MPITLPIGDTLSIAWTLYGAGGLPIDLTGCQAAFGIINAKGASVFQVSTADTLGDLTIPAPAIGGIVKLVVAPGITALFPVGINGINPCKYGLRVTFADGTKYTEDMDQILIAWAPANG